MSARRRLSQVARLSREIAAGELAALLAAAQSLPALLLVGAQDRLVVPARCEAIAGELGPLARCCVLPECGHLPHEEAPACLLALLAPFAAEALGGEPAAAGDGVSGSAWADTGDWERERSGSNASASAAASPAAGSGGGLADAAGAGGGSCSDWRRTPESPAGGGGSGGKSNETPSSGGGVGGCFSPTWGGADRAVSPPLSYPTV